MEVERERGEGVRGEERGETEIEKVVGCARRGEAGKVNSTIGVNHAT